MGRRISVMVPIYQAREHLKRCVDSILGQTYRDLEVILVDDGSTDGSLEICQEYARIDSRVVVIHKENGGVSSARNAGLEAMTGEYLMMVDSDDYVEATMAADLLAAADREDAQLVIGGLDFVYESGEATQIRCPSRAFAGTREAFAQQMFLELYDKQLLNNQNNKLYDIRMIKESRIRYDESMCINEDVWFCMRALTQARRVACLPGVYYHYWQHSHGESLVTRFWPNGVDTCFVLLKAVRECLGAAKAPASLQNAMGNRMIFHICGFAGLCYYRSGYSAGRCLEEVKRLAARPEWKELLSATRPKGVKNRVAAFLLGHGLCRPYHGLCLLLYHGKRRVEMRRRDER